MKTGMKTAITVILALALLALGACGSANSAAEAVTTNVYVLSGPTGIGALNLWEAADAGRSDQTYNFTLTGANDEIVAALSNGSADIAAVATNLASVLYNKTGGGITVLAVNTAGVLYVLSNGEELSTAAELAGHRIYLPGQGANPEYILRYVLEQNGLNPDTDVELCFVGEGSELLSVWAQDPQALIMAPQPVATSLLMQNESARQLLDMTAEWDAVTADGSRLMMGCVVVRNEFLQQHPDAVQTFMQEYEASIRAAQEDIEHTAALCEGRGIIAKAALAQRAIPLCGLCYVTGAEMREGLSGYLGVMYAANPASVGGALPGEDFYYAG